MTSAKPSSSVLKSLLLATLLIVSIVAVYRPASNGGFVWDDDDYVTRNPLLVAPDGLKRIWFSLDAPSQYFPLTYTTLRIERHIWGLSPTGYHWTNILLHAVNAVLVWRLLRRLKIPGAYLAAFIFALHPVQVESVAWISERKNVLMGLFFLLTLIAWTAFLQKDLHPRKWFYYSLGLLAYTFALTAKSTACTLPAALFLILWLKAYPITRARILQVVPFVTLGLMMGLITVWWERYHVGTRGPMFALGPIDRILVASRAIWFYLSKLVWPSDLTFIYPQWDISRSDPLAYIFPVACIVAALIIWRLRSRFGRSIEVALAYHVATLAPLLGFIMLYTFRYTYVADHYQYLACIGPIALVAAGITRLVPVKAAAVVTAGILASLGILTWRQAGTYRDIETLWRTTIARNPGCWMAFNNLGIALFDQKRVDEAIEAYRNSLRLRANYAQTHYNFANALLEKGDVSGALDESREALRLQPRDPDAYVTLGNAFLARDEIDRAVEQYARSIDLRHNNPTAHYNLGNALLKKGDNAAAATEFETTIRLDPTFIDAYAALAQLATEAGQWSKAIEQYTEELKLSPNAVAACNNLAWILASCPDTSLRNGRQAVELAERATRLSGDENPVVLHTLAASYAQDGQFDRAVQCAQKARTAALQEGHSLLAEDLGREIEIYRAHSPYPSTPP